MKVNAKRLVNLFKENKIGFLLNDCTKSGYMVGGVHGFGLKVLCPEDYTASDLEKAYNVYIRCCEILGIEPKEFNEVV